MQYYTSMVNTTILIALTSIATKQGKPMQEMMKKVKQLLNCATQQEDATITYNASKMIMLHTFTLDTATKRKHK